MFEALIRNNRSYRRFDESFGIDNEQLKKIVNFARLSPSAANLQPLKYIVCADSAKNADIFDTLNWAAYLKDWKGPEKGERPTAYIILLQDQNIKKVLDFDQGIAAQSIMLGAVSMGLGGCMIASFNRKKLLQLLCPPENLNISLVMAIGKPVEIVQIEDIKDDNVKYWRDENQVHHVPKRTLNEIVVKEF